MNYRHIFHAGNFADVFKHLILLELLGHFSKKETLFACLDIHAGAGLYDLRSVEAQKTSEFAEGVGKLVQNTATPMPAHIKSYSQLLDKAGYPDHYPGSPWLAHQYLRPTDHLVLIEKEPEAVKALRHLFLKDKSIAIHHRDAYEGLQALLPPKAGRGLILIDPPYESPKEWDSVIAAVTEGLRRFRQGVFAIWYPIKPGLSTQEPFQREVKKLKSALPSGTSGLISTLSVLNSDVRQGLIGSGMIVLNPPWQLEQQINTWLPWLWRSLSCQGQGRYEISTF